MLSFRGPLPEHHLTEQQAKEIYIAKCEDLMISPSEPREERFMNILNRNCSGHEFDLRDTGIGEKAGQVVARVLASSTEYHTLNLAGNTIRNTGAVAIADLLLKNRHITSVDLRSNDVGAEGGVRLFEALKINNTLTAIDLSGMSGINRNHIGTAGAHAVADATRVNVVLKKIALRENGFGADGAAIIAEGMRYNEVLSHMDLGSNSIGFDGAAILGEALLSSGLLHLSLSRNKIGDAGAKAIAQFIGSSRTIQSIDLSHNKIGPAAGRFLGLAMRDNQSLESINLEKNDLGSIGTKEIAEALRVSPSTHLKVLILASNKIDERGAQDLSEMLRLNRVLVKLDLATNFLCDAGATHFGAAIRDNKTLQFLDISTNKIGDSGGRAFVSNLRFNTGLRHLSIKNNSMTEETGEDLSNYIKLNHTLLNLEISFNDFNYKHITIVEKKIKDNVKRYKSAAIDRYRSQIDVLSVDENRLLATQAELQRIEEKRARANELLKEKLGFLSLTDQQYRDKVNEINTLIAEETKLVHKTEARHNSLSQEAGKIRQDKETRYWAMVQQLHKAKDNNTRLQKKIGSKKQQLEDLRKNTSQDAVLLDLELKDKEYDRQQVENSVKHLMEQIERVKAQIAESRNG
eukprot:TRINITY_DN27338_c0_g1_i1.p1 TRINITY_DN27338_c0_g1~~TRINITY_DN27338_c0_g1_i1.p1  ORF type:complete len:632 (+),score=262.65 TRINITY_DN27338_c0_g1_i1:103-1998(+)